MKMVHISSDTDSCIDQILMAVPDDFDKKRVLQDAEENGIPNPCIESVYNVFPVPGQFNRLDEYRVFWG